ncbi:class I SAM-dependent methyltransferase [Streptomyces sp. NPDC015661]|uniref:class I SAM-dependent methyltransferase n=1 Tax=Streptomyces sp. NPDC015661 TaxID=3364961 RepID=UPI0036F65F97
MTSVDSNQRHAVAPDEVATPSDFADVGAAYDAHSRSARGRLRHDLVERRLRAELNGRPLRVLDAGCGTGETTLRLALAGHLVTAVDASDGMLAVVVDRLAAHPDLEARVRLLRADVEDLDIDTRFDLVCCHGVLMYLGRADKAIARLARLVADHGLLSILTKNRQAIGVREALRGEHATARQLIASGTGVTVGSLGIRTRGDRAEELDRLAAAHGLSPLPWQGVRILNDHRVDWAPDDEEYASALETEWAASTRDPYRQLAPLVHTLARRVPEPSVNPPAP